MRGLSGVLLIVILGCDQDPLGCAVGKLPSGYRLLRWDGDQDYYLIGPDKDEGRGVLDGTVVQIGWTDQFIVAQRHANFTATATGGWA
jgi:hypothetical protein